MLSQFSLAAVASGSSDSRVTAVWPKPSKLQAQVLDDLEVVFQGLCFPHTLYILCSGIILRVKWTGQVCSC